MGACVVRGVGRQQLLQPAPHRTPTHTPTRPGDDILVGKTVSLPEDPTGLQRFTRRDASLALRNSEAGVVDQVGGGVMG